eukprot:243059_1
MSPLLWNEICNLLFFGICSMLLSIIIILELIACIKNKEKSARFLKSVCLVAFILYLLYGIVSLLNISLIYSNQSTESICHILSMVVSILYFLGRGAYNCIFVYKLYIIFHGAPALQYSPTMLRNLFIFILTFYSIFGILYAWDNIHQNVSKEYQSGGICVGGIEWAIFGPFILVDIAISVLLLYLFIKKLKVLVMSCGEDDDDGKLQRIMLKSTVLVIVAIFTTLFLAPIGSYFQANWNVFIVGPIDWTVNAFCVIFLEKQYNEFYQKLCCVPNKCVIICCAKKLALKQDKNIKNLEISAVEK